MTDAVNSDREPAEELLRLIRTRLAELFGCPPEEIDTARELASFGLSSLQSMILMGELEERVGFELDPQLFSAEQTLAELAGVLAGRIEQAS